jgi:hypothetical protein
MTDMEVESEEEVKVEIGRKKKIKKVVMDKVEKGSMKEKVLKVLETNELTDKRSQKLHWS